MFKGSYENSNYNTRPLYAIERRLIDFLVFILFLCFIWLVCFNFLFFDCFGSFLIWCHQFYPEECAGIIQWLQTPTNFQALVEQSDSEFSIKFIQIWWACTNLFYVVNEFLNFVFNFIINFTLFALHNILWSFPTETYEIGCYLSSNPETIKYINEKIYWLVFKFNWLALSKIIILKLVFFRWFSKFFLWYVLYFRRSFMYNCTIWKSWRCPDYQYWHIQKVRDSKRPILMWFLNRREKKVMKRRAKWEKRGRFIAKLFGY